MRSVKKQTKIQQLERLDQQINTLVSEHGKDWELISSLLEVKKDPIYIRNRYFHYISQCYNKDKFSKEEEFLIISKLEEYGTKWKKIAEKLNKRTQIQVKNYFHSHLKQNFFKNYPSLIQQYPNVVNMIINSKFKISEETRQYLLNKIHNNEENHYENTNLIQNRVEQFNNILDMDFENSSSTSKINEQDKEQYQWIVKIKKLKKENSNQSPQKIITNERNYVEFIDQAKNNQINEYDPNFVDQLFSIDQNKNKATNQLFNFPLQNLNNFKVNQMQNDINNQRLFFNYCFEETKEQASQINNFLSSSKQIAENKLVSPNKCEFDMSHSKFFDPNTFNISDPYMQTLFEEINQNQIF